MKPRAMGILTVTMTPMVQMQSSSNKTLVAASMTIPVQPVKWGRGVGINSRRNREGTNENVISGMHISALAFVFGSMYCFR